MDASHIKQVLESIVSSSNLEFTAHKLGERLTQVLTIQNNISEIIIEGCWELAPHPNDPPHTPNSHQWISITPKTFNSNQIECLVTVDTSKLMTDRVYKRDMILRTNCNQEIYQVALNIKTSPLPPEIRQMPWLNLVGLWVISAIIPALLIAAAYAIFIVFCVIAFGFFISTLRRD